MMGAWFQPRLCSATSSTTNLRLFGFSGKIIDQKKDILHTSAGKEIDRVVIEEKRRNEEEIAVLRRKASSKQRSQEVRATKEALKMKMADAQERSNRVASNFRKEHDRLQQSARAMEARTKQDARRLKKLDRKVERMKQESQLLASKAQEHNNQLRQEMGEVRARAQRDIESLRNRHKEATASLGSQYRSQGECCNINESDEDSDFNNWQDDSFYEDLREDAYGKRVDENSRYDDDYSLQYALLADDDTRRPFY
ncbi:hypothetical protein NMY22_g20210 [Coprinellus aureogranulatus]|nr:hypothetical protein NMY22_g20210 [Coprinellus aureogranulatus]